MGFARIWLVVACVCAFAALLAVEAGGSEAASGGRQARPVPSLTPNATAKAWRSLVQRRQARLFSATAACRPLRAVFYAGTDWMRLATKLAAGGSPCAEYYISVPPLVADKTQPRADQAWRIRALGPNFHAMAEVNLTAWSSWVAATGSSWYEAGVEARRRMAAAGYDVTLGDTWALNELSSAVRRGDGSARANARALLRGLFEGDGSLPTTRGAVFVVGIGQATTELSVYQARLQDWLEDSGFWADMSAYVSDWSQELYGDVRNYAVPGALRPERRDALNDYLQHELALARVGPSAAAAARSFLERAYSPLANAAWQYDAAFGWTLVPAELMKHYVSAQTYALRHASAQASEDHAGFAWAPKNTTGMPSTDFASQTGGLLDRLAAAIRDSAQPVDAADPGVGACGPPGENLWCAGDVDGAWFNNGWRSFAAWKPSTLAFTTAPQTLTAGAASAPVTVELRTYSGVPLAATSPLAVALASTSAGGLFSTAPEGPWASKLTATVATGSSTTTFYYRDTAAGSPVITAWSSGKQSARQTMRVNLGALPSVSPQPPAGVPPAASPAPGVEGGEAGRAGDAAPSPMPAAPAATVPPVAAPTPASGSVRVAPPLSARVASIFYAARRGDLLVTLKLIDGARKPLPGVSVSIAISRNGVQYRAVARTRRADGKATYRLRRAPRGCYSTKVRRVAAQGWNGATPRNRFCR